MLTVLTESEGKLSASARGVMRKSSRITAGCQLCAWSEFTFFENNGRCTVDSAEPLELFLGLRESIPGLALASYITELLDAVSDADAPAPEILRLGLNTLFALSKRKLSRPLLKAAFELRLLALSGYEPSLGACSLCGETGGETFFFSPSGGALLCPLCRKKAGDGGALLIGGGALEAMRHAVFCEPGRVFSFSLGDKSAAELKKSAEAYLLSQLDRSFKTLEFYHNMDVIDGE